MTTENGKDMVAYRPPVLSQEVVAIVSAATPPSEIKSRQGRAGQTFKYVDTPYIIELLNRAFKFGWSFETQDITPAALLATNHQIIVKGRLTVHGDNGIAIVKEQFGSAEVKMFSEQSGKTGPVDVADDFKAAASDALKKCASLFGIAADVYSGGMTGQVQSVSTDTSTASYVKKDIPSGDWEKKPATQKQIDMLRKFVTNKKMPLDVFDAFLAENFGVSDFPNGLLAGQVTKVLDFLRDWHLPE